MTDDTTAPTTDTVDASVEKATMAAFSHTNPHTGEPFGEDDAFQRGPAVAADGGGRDAADEADDADGASDEPATMADIDHEHPDADAAEANRVFQRGREQRSGEQRNDTV
mgnify:CR=1 FL=1